LQNKQVEILETIECLPFEQYEVLFQRYFQHRTIQQIAEDRNCTTSNIQKTKKKAFDNLKIMKRF
jgi:DNA-directed RNA polymerase specialized sigma24 family protein